MDNLITITGDNSYSCRQELQAIKAEFIKKSSDFGVQQIDCRETMLQEVKRAIMSPALLSPEKLIVLENTSTNKDLVAELEELVKNAPESAQIVIFDQKLDKRTALYKFLKKHSQFKEFTSLEKPGLVNWADSYIKANNGQASRKNIVYLIDRIGVNQQLLKNEIDKLLLYNSEITADSINELTVPTPQSSIFDLIDAAFSGNLQKANKLYDEQRALKVEPQNIIAMLTWQLHILALIKTAGDRSPTEIAKEAKISPYTISKSEKIAKKMTFEKLKSLIGDLAELDFLSKTKTLDLDEGLKNYLVKLSA